MGLSTPSTSRQGSGRAMGSLWRDPDPLSLGDPDRPVSDAGHDVNSPAECLDVPAALQQPLRVIPALPQLRDRHLDRPGPGLPVPPPVPVTGVHPVGADLPIRCPAQLLDFGVHYPLREPLDHLAQKIGGRADARGSSNRTPGTGTMSLTATSF